VKHNQIAIFILLGILGWFIIGMAIGLHRGRKSCQDTPCICSSYDPGEEIVPEDSTP